jgi:ribosome maturation factor RimP
LDYISLHTVPHYDDCAPLVEGLGYILVELRIIPQRGSVRILAVIASPDAKIDIGVNDCSKVHRVLLPRIQALLGTDDTYMEVTSPGMERNIRNAAEFALFQGREVRVWDKTVNDWVGGFIVLSDTVSVTLEKRVPETEMPARQTVFYENIAKAKFIHL